MKKRVLFITNAFTCGGIENALFDLVQGMDKERFDITIFALYKGHEWDLKFLDLGVRIVFATPVLHNRLNVFERIKIHNDYKKLYYSRNNNGEGLLDIFFDESFDLIICYHGYSDVSACFSLGRNAKTIEYAHCAVDTNSEIREDILRNQQAIKECDRIICVSKKVKEQIDRLLGVEKKTIVAHNPISYMRICDLATAYDFEMDSPYICAIGNFVEGKNFVLLVNIFAKLLSQGVNYKLVIVGDGSDMVNVRSAIQDNNIKDYVVLTGYKENPYPIIKNSKYLVISSFDEGMPVVAMESLCLEVPVISAYPSVEELFANEKCGIITESSEEGLFDALNAVLSDEELYKVLKKGAINRSDYYKNNGDLKRVERIYLDLIEEGHADNR